MEENPVIEYVHYVRIVEFQSWNNVRGQTQQPFLVGVSDPYDASDENAIVYNFYDTCRRAALGTCDVNVLRALDEEGNVWHGLEVVIRHVKPAEEEQGT